MMDYNSCNHDFWDLECPTISPDGLQNSERLVDITKDFGVLIGEEEDFYIRMILAKLINANVL